MVRSFGTSRYGTPFDRSVVEAVWQKGRIAQGFDPAKWRRDACGALISRAAHGDTESDFGWEIDHVVAVAKGGSDGLANLQPLQWRNNRAKSDGPLECVVRV